MKYKKWLLLGLSLILIMAVPLNGEAAQKKVSATISSDVLKKGNTISIQSKTNGVTYMSNDPRIAYVNNEGVITGKKKGTATISVKKSGYVTKNFTMRVVANGKLPNLPVCYDEVSLENLMINQNEDGTGMTLSAVVKNSSKYGTIRKVQYIYEITNIEETENTKETSEIPETIEVEGTTEVAGTTETTETTEKAAKTKVVKRVTLQTTGLAPGESSKKITCEGPDSGLVQDVKLVSVKIYSGNALVIYQVEKDILQLKWGTKDTTAPTISGMISKNSYNGNDIFMVAYPDKKYNFEKYVTVQDDRDSTVTLKVDTSKINWKKKGIYTITYSASDKAGNTTNAKAKVQIRLVEMVDKYADAILKKIVKDSWSDTKKAVAIYKYVRKNLSYIDSNDHASWEKSALYGLKYKSGNCFVFYSLGRALLTRSGIPNITITRSQGHGHHWWNLVYVQGGWYHFDTTPRRMLAYTCLLTDAQLTEYSNKGGGSHIWKSSAYPKRATKKINKVVMGKRY